MKTCSDQLTYAAEFDDTRLTFRIEPSATNGRWVKAERLERREGLVVSQQFAVFDVLDDAVAWLESDMHRFEANEMFLRVRKRLESHFIKVTA